MEISFVVATYDQPRALRTCLSSILERNDEAVEVIVVDNYPLPMHESGLLRLGDGDLRLRYLWTALSTDFPPHLKGRIRHHHCLYTALEMGAQVAQGQWLCFCGADAYFAPVFAERMLQVAHDDPDADLILCDLILGGPHHGYFPLTSQPHNCSCDLQGMMIRRSAFKGFPEKWVNYELADGLMVDGLIAEGIKWAKANEFLGVKN